MLCSLSRLSRAATYALIRFAILIAALQLTPSYSQSVSGQALELLKLSLKCPLQPVTISNEDDGRFKTTDLTTKVYIGDERTLRIAGKTERRVHNTELQKTGAVDRDFSYVASYNDLSSVEAKESSIIINCSQNRTCIEHAVKSKECNQTLLLQEGCNGPDKIEKRALSSMTLNFCDKDTGDNAKEAILALINLNPGTPEPASRASSSARDSNVMENNFVIVRPKTKVETAK